MLCIKCNYGWEPRVQSPKECPSCKVRMDRVKRLDLNIKPIEVYF